jgi:hypothetical protein
VSVVLPENSVTHNLTRNRCDRRFLGHVNLLIYVSHGVSSRLQYCRQDLFLGLEPFAIHTLCIQLKSVLDEGIDSNHGTSQIELIRTSLPSAVTCRLSFSRAFPANPPRVLGIYSAYEMVRMAKAR